MALTETRVEAETRRHTAQRVLLPAALFGFGFAAVLDVIVFHQLLQWHHLVSNQVTIESQGDLEANTRWDGVLDLAMWGIAGLAAVLFVSRLLRGTRPAGRAVLGAVVLGAGLFNVYDGVVDHLVLRLHDVREGKDETFWNIAWLIASFAMVGAGVALLRTAPSIDSGHV